ncbi:hypothetical protein [Chitinophaga polysaccharea]|uniref:hypothetical protein n=1 Tax=Chitinophaga polysaccharea TaxID=1293035 RepID=UPI0011587F9D|nr:hypothetical protein [Chitinophaga polysaccharea]
MSKLKPTGVRIEFEPFNATITELKKNASQKHFIITDEIIMEKIKISKIDLIRYYETDRAPDNVFNELRTHFGDYLKVKIIRIITTSIDENPESDLD